MRKFLRRAAALALSLATLATTALASDALGSRLYAYTLDICNGATLTRQVMWSASRSDLRTENYVTYTPNPSVSPKVSYGSTVTSKQTVYSMAKSLEAAGDRVLSGINGDYFVMATGDPLGLVVTDGVLRSSASYLSAIGFRADGSAVAGKPDLKLLADFNGYSLKISEINKIRSGAGYFLFSSDFGPSTKNTRKGVDVILSPIGQEGQAATGADGTTPLTVSRQLGIGKRVPCRVEQVIQADGATAIPAGKFVLSISETGGDWLLEVIQELQPGDQLDIEISSADTRWNDVDCAVGSLYHILSNGAVTSQQESGSTAAPRTAVGVKADGSVIFYTIDGRQSGYSVGATTKMVAQRLAELGCTEGLLMDGGGSTSFISTYPDQSASTTMNKPSEGTARAVTNAIFLVSNLNPTGVPGSLYVTPKNLTLLAGGSTQCGAVAMDTGWYPMGSLPGAVSWWADQGSVSASGLYTAPRTGGVYTVTAESGGVTGSTKVTVYDTPDAIRLTDNSTGKSVSSLSLTPGQTVDLNASATYRTIALTGDDTCFDWSADVGTITKNGVFTAGSVNATGKITISAGSHTASIPVTVSAPPKVTLLADFEDGGKEGDHLFFTAGAGSRWDFSADQVKYGRRSCQWDYGSQDGAASLTVDPPVTLGDADRYLSLWVYGDNSGGTLFALFPREDGSLASQTTSLNFSGWKRFTCAIPSDAVSFQGLKVSGSKAGTLWLDQLVLSNQTAEDTQAPAVALTVSGANVTAKITDNATNSIAKERISLTLDGKDVPFTYSSGALTATLSSLGKSYHQVTVTAADASGNLGRDSKTIAGSPSTPFADMNGHWAAACTTRLYELGVVTGTTSGTTPLFSPNQAVTRGDFALMCARWLNLDLNSYASVALPYADTTSIPAWDLNAVKALYAQGIMQGSAGNDGKLYANAKASITRAEAMTILSRMQAKGYPEVSLTGFSDAGSVPGWAKSAVASLVGQKVVSGSNGQLRPTASISRAEVAKLLMSLW